MNQNNIDKILENYDSFSPVVLKNLRTILDHGALGGSGKMFFLAVDQGFEHGPDASFFSNESAYDPIYHFELGKEAGLSALAAPYGFLTVGAKKFAGKIPLILKINHSNSLNKSRMNQAIVSSVERALELGCVGIGFTIYPGSDDLDEMLEELGYASEEASKFGLLSVVWSYARGPELKNGLDTALDVISYSAHMACLAGAHIVKVKIPNSSIYNQNLKTKFDSTLNLTEMSERIAHIKKSCFNGKRLVIFSGGASKENKDSLYSEIEAIKKGGGDGSIIGRNIFQRNKDEALQIINQIKKIYL
jgi:class I fructose-bisphosphate aldolase